MKKSLPLFGKALIGPRQPSAHAQTTVVDRIDAAAKPLLEAFDVLDRLKACAE